jgi:hypothetical protein
MYTVNLPLSNVSDSAISFLLLRPARQRRSKCNHFLLDGWMAGQGKEGRLFTGPSRAEVDVYLYTVS